MGGDYIKKALEQAAPDCVRYNVPLAKVSAYKIGGPADIYVEPDTIERAAAVFKTVIDAGHTYTIIGDTSNILFDDAGYRGVLIRIGAKLSRIAFEDETTARAQAGIWTPYFVRKIVNKGLKGCVHAVGIPGTLGGLIVMNGGSQRKGIGEQILDVTIIDANGNIRTVTREECRFSYRASSLQEMPCLVVEARFRYEPDDAGALRREAVEILAERKRKFPRQYPNCGSVFLSNPAMYPVIGPPGQAIEKVGLKGVACGNAQIAPLHGNFIINRGGALSEDVLSLIDLIRRAVYHDTGFSMDCEVRYLPPEGTLIPAHIETDRRGGELDMPLNTAHSQG